MNPSEVFPEIPEDTAGDTPIPESLDSLKDRDLAQRIATSVFGKYFAKGLPTPKEVTVNVEELIGLTVGDVYHEVAYVKVSKLDYSGAPYVYGALYCSHDLIHLRDDRFPDENGQPQYSGLYSGSGMKCPAKKAVISLKTGLVKSEYLANTEYTDFFGYLRPEKKTDLVLDLVARHENNEWVGPDASTLYLQHFEPFIGDFYEANRICELLVDEGAIERSGNMVYLARENTPRPRPQALYATYREEMRGEEFLDVKVFIPSGYKDPQEVRFEVRRHGLLHYVSQQPLRKGLDNTGRLLPQEVNDIAYTFARGIRDWRSPYVEEGVTRLLTLVEDLPPYELDPNPAPIDKTKFPYGHQNLSVSDFGNWYCSACEQQGEYESPSDYPCIVK